MAEQVPFAIIHRLKSKNQEYSHSVQRVQRDRWIKRQKIRLYRVSLSLNERVLLGESESGFVIPDHMDSSTPKYPAKSEKGLFCYDNTGGRHVIFISERYFFSITLEFV